MIPLYVLEQKSATYHPELTLQQNLLQARMMGYQYLEIPLIMLLDRYMATEWFYIPLTKDRGSVMTRHGHYPKYRTTGWCRIGCPSCGMLLSKEDLRRLHCSNCGDDSVLRMYI